MVSIRTVALIVPRGRPSSSSRVREDVVPEARLEVALELRQVEVRPGAAVEQAAPVVEEVQAEVEQARGDRLAVEDQVAFGEMPAARPHEQRRDLVAEAVGLVLALELDRALDRVDQVRLALDHVGPGRRVGVLEVRHEHLRARVERVDHHLPVGRARDLDAAVLEIGRDGVDRPVRLADLARLREEVGQLAGVEAPLPLGAGCSSSARRGPNRRCRPATKASASSVRISSLRGPAGAASSARVTVDMALVVLVVALAEVRARARRRLRGGQHVAATPGTAAAC